MKHPPLHALFTRALGAQVSPEASSFSVGMTAIGGYVIGSKGRMDLHALRIGAPEQLVGEVASELAGCRSVEAAATLLCRTLYERCRSGRDGERSLVLSRLYLSLPFSQLDPDSQAFARSKFSIEPVPADAFLALLGTWGDELAWCDRTSSQSHRAVPLDRDHVRDAPMLARCFQQIGIDVDRGRDDNSDLHVVVVEKKLGLFHVEEAQGSPFVPAQEDFVVSRGIRTVVGCGSMLPDGAISIWIGFSRHLVLHHEALALLPMLPTFWPLVQPLYRKGALFGS